MTLFLLHPQARLLEEMDEEFGVDSLLKETVKDEKQKVKEDKKMFVHAFVKPPSPSPCCVPPPPPPPPSLGIHCARPSWTVSATQRGHLPGGPDLDPHSEGLGGVGRRGGHAGKRQHCGGGEGGTY